MVRNLKKFFENRNELFEVGSIGNKAGAKIEIEDVSALELNSKKKHEKLWSKTEKTNFRKEINRLMSRGVIKPISDSENGFVSSIFLREREGEREREREREK